MFSKIKNKKKFFKLFFISFAAGAAFFALLFFVILRGIFFNAYVSKGDKSFAKTEFTKAAEYYATAKGWRAKDQSVYIKLANAYIGALKFDEAGKIIDEAIDKNITSDDAGLEQLYIMRIKVFTAAGQFGEAVKYTDSIEDQYIIKKIQAARPADLTYTPTQGSYDKTLKMQITAGEGQTIYYTTDQSAPTNASNIYVNPINIGIGQTNVQAVAVDRNGLVSSLLNVTYTVSNDNAEVQFDDAKVENMVRQSLSKPAGTIRVKELEGVTELSSSGVDGQIRSLSDLELMPNLETLHLESETSMLSISQISGRSKLKVLSLCGCKLTTEDINVLAGLSELEVLDISDNNITSISVLSGLTKLKHVYMSRNIIDDISPLAASPDIETIDAAYNAITSVPDLTATQKLHTLILGSNRISDVSTLHRMTALSYLDLSGNRIKNAKNLSALANLEGLDLSDNDISNFSFLSSLKKLTDLNVSDTSFVNEKVLAGLNLSYFYARNTGLASVNTLGAMTNLVGLGISDTNVTDIAPLLDCKMLNYLDISNCDISNLAPLSAMPELYSLEARGVDLTGIQFIHGAEINIVQ